MNHDDIERILISADEIQAKLQEMGAQILKGAVRGRVVIDVNA